MKSFNNYPPLISPKPIEVTEEKAIALYASGITVYIAINNQSLDTAFNCFTMNIRSKDASLNFYTEPGVPVDLVAAIKYIKGAQKPEDVKFYTLFSSELYVLPLQQPLLFVLRTDKDPYPAKIEKSTQRGYLIDLPGGAYYARYNKIKEDKIFILDLIHATDTIE